MFKEALKRNKGITLIALVVTIIVLLLLAGISISMLAGQNGILNRAREAKEEYSNSTEKEQIQLSYNSAITNKLGDSITAEDLQNELDEMLGKNSDGTSKTETIDMGNGVFNIKFVETNRNYKIDNGKVSLLPEEDKSVVEPKNLADWEYDVNDDGTLTITGYKGSDTEVVIPNYIGGVKVKKIGYSDATNSIWASEIRDDDIGFWYLGCMPCKAQKTIRKITISYGIEEIGRYVFAGTVNLETVSIPSSVKSNGEYTFYDCISLKNVTMQPGITNIGKYSFSGCSSLNNITIPSSVTSIGLHAFSACSSLTSITIPSSVTSIGEYAFWGCSSLTSINIPSSITSIGKSAFTGCSNLTSITIPPSITNIEECTFMNCSSLNSIIIPSSVTSIGLQAFSGCSSLTSITIPSNVTKMGRSIFLRNTFNNCNSSIQIRRKPTKWLGF